MSKTPQEQLHQIRAKIEALVNERDEIEAAPIPRDEVEAQIAVVIDAQWSDQILSPEPSGVLHGGFNGAELQRMIARPALLVAVIPDAVKAYLMGLYDRDLGAAAPGLPALQRRRRLAELDAEIFALEVSEERQVEQLEAEGVDVIRRPDADPAAALGLGVRGEAA